MPLKKSTGGTYNLFQHDQRVGRLGGGGHGFGLLLLLQSFSNPRICLSKGLYLLILTSFSFTSILIHFNSPLIFLIHFNSSSLSIVDLSVCSWWLGALRVEPFWMVVHPQPPFLFFFLEIMFSFLLSCIVVLQMTNFFHL